MSDVEAALPNDLTGSSGWIKSFLGQAEVAWILQKDLSRGNYVIPT